MINQPDTGGGGNATPAPQTVATPPLGGGKNSFSITDLKQYFHIVVKRIWLVALCFVISLVVTVVMLMREVPVYSSSARILLSSGIPLPGPLKQSEVRVMGDYILTQQNIIHSRLVISRARERVNRPAAEIGQKLRGIAVNRVWKTAFLSVDVRSDDPIFASEFANALADEYVDFKAEERLDTSQSTVISLTQQANRLHEELRVAEERILDFERDNNVIGLNELGNLASKQLGDLASEAASYRTQRMLLEYQRPLLDEAPDEVVLEVLSSPLAPLASDFRGSSISSLGRDNTIEVALGRGPEKLIERGFVDGGDYLGLRYNQARAEAELVHLRTNYRDQHPRVIQKIRDLKSVDRELNIELQFALRKYYTKLETLAIKEQAAKRVELEWQDEAIRMSKIQHEFDTLNKNADRLESLYDLIFNRLKEIDVSLGIEPETVRIMERAHPATSPSSPRKMQSIFISALVGLGVGLGLVFGLEFIDDSLRFPEEVTQGLGLPFFGVIPAANWDPDDLRTHMLSNIDQKSGLAEAYRNVRSSLLFSAAQSNHKSLVLTSAVPLEGKTTTCLNLAVSLAQAGLRVLMVDGDLRRGELHKFFGLEGGRGFSDVVSGQAKPESVIQRTGVPNLDLVATGPFPPNPAELMLRPELGLFLEYAKRTYDRILFDCPPVMAVSEAAILASQADAAIVVIWAGQTSKKLCQMTVQVLRERGANLIGCVLNNLEFGRVGYYYYSTYYGYYDYDYRYGYGSRDSSSSSSSTSHPS